MMAFLCHVSPVIAHPWVTSDLRAREIGWPPRILPTGLYRVPVAFWSPVQRRSQMYIDPSRLEVVRMSAIRHACWGRVLVSSGLNTTFFRVVL